MSAQSCGCDPEAYWLCERHRDPGPLRGIVPVPDGWNVSEFCEAFSRVRQPMLPTDDKARKALPIFDGVLAYFPDAICAVAAVSQAGNDQHNPGEPLHWARDKSMDQMNTAVRHMMDHGMGVTKDTDGQWHLAKAAWRVLAALQLAIEAEEK